MFRIVILVAALLTLSTSAQEPQTTAGATVEVVATATEYVPRDITFSHPGHSFTNCFGSAVYFARFNSYGSSGTVSGTAETNSSCSTTWEPPTTSTTTLIRQYDY